MYKFYAIFMLLLLWSLLRNHFRGLWLEVLISSISDAMDGQRRTTRSKCQKSTRVPSNLALFGHFFFSEVRGYLKCVTFLRYYVSKYPLFCLLFSGLTRTRIMDFQRWSSKLSKSKNTTLRQYKATKNNKQISEFS